MEDGVADQRVVDRDDRLHTRRRPGQFFLRHDVTDRIHPRAAVCLWNHHPHQSQCGRLLDDLGGEHRRVVQGRGAREDFLPRKLPHSRLNHPVFVGQLKVHAYLNLPNLPNLHNLPPKTGWVV